MTLLAPDSTDFAQGYIEPMVSRLSIADKSGNIIPFTPNWAQRIYFNELERGLAEGRPLRFIILKSRQIGLSTATEAYIYAMSFVLPHSRCAVIADEVDNANHLLSMTDLYWETDPLKPLYHTKYQARNTLHWNETASSIRTMTAGNKKAGRSRTIQMLHASEVAFWLEAETVMTGLAKAVPKKPRTLIVLESTANGMGNYFEKTWAGAMSGDNDYIPLFFPWWMHPENRASWVGLPARDLGHLDKEEQELLQMFRMGLKIGRQFYQLPEEHWFDALTWRRHAIRNDAQNDINKFHQEEPSTPEEAFISTGTNVFPIEHLRACFKPKEGIRGRLHRDGNRVSFQGDIAGPFTVFKKPAPDADYGIYVVGADPSHAIHDRAVAQVINRRSFEQVAVWRGMVDPSHFAEDLAKIGIYYNQALLSSENEGPGYATIGALIQLEYPNLYQPQQPENLPGRFVGKYGFSSSYKTKAEAIGWLIKLLVDHETTIHDRVTFEEMRNYVTLPGGEFGPASSEGYDDHVTSYAIGVVSSIKEGPLPAYGMGTAGEVGGSEDPPWMGWGEQ